MNTIAFKVYPETETLFKQIKEESDTKTADQFINLLLENYQNPRKVEVSKQCDIEALQFVQSEIKVLEAEIEELRANNQQLQTAVAQSGLIPPGSILFQVSESELQTIEAIKPYLIKAGYEGTSDQALYAAIRKNYIVRQ